MEIYSIGQSLPGHPDCGTIQIIYSIPPGIQVGVAESLTAARAVLHAVPCLSSRVRSIPTRDSPSAAGASPASASSQTTSKAER